MFFIFVILNPDVKILPLTPYMNDADLKTESRGIHLYWALILCTLRKGLTKTGLFF
jgi:hypothetical protein